LEGSQRTSKPADEENHWSIGSEEPEEKAQTTTECLEKLKPEKELRMEELNLAFGINWAVMEQKVREKVIEDTWARTEVGRELWNQ
jgi:hypothetical protein